MPILCLFSCDINALSATIRKSLTNDSGAITQFEPDFSQCHFFTHIGPSLRFECKSTAGLDGFWVHRLLHSEGIESYVVDPASIATSRRRRRAKTDGEALVRALLAYKRGEPRVFRHSRAQPILRRSMGRLCLTQSAAAAGYHCFHQATLAIADTGGIAFLMPLFQAINFKRLLQSPRQTKASGFPRNRTLTGPL